MLFNLELAQQVIGLIENKLKENQCYDQSTFCTLKVDGDYNICKTQHCIAGWICYLADDDLKKLLHDYNYLLFKSKSLSKKAENEYKTKLEDLKNEIEGYDYCKSAIDLLLEDYSDSCLQQVLYNIFKSSDCDMFDKFCNLVSDLEVLEDKHDVLSSDDLILIEKYLEDMDISDVDYIVNNYERSFAYDDADEFLNEIVQEILSENPLFGNNHRCIDKDELWDEITCNDDFIICNDYDNLFYVYRKI